MSRLCNLVASLACLSTVAAMATLTGPADASASVVGASVARATAGPPLSVPAGKRADSLVCSPHFAAAERAPVLLIPGTTLTAATNFDWNYEPALTDRKIPWCAVTLPGNATDDIQVSAEYVVSALRTMHRRTDRDIRVVGFSQGGMISRWALKYWPGTRELVNDVVGIDPSNHGTIGAYAACASSCAPAFRQQQTGSHFLTALNTGPETWAGIDYSVVYTLTDEVVIPNLGPRASSRLRTGKGRISNISAQSICPVHVADHLSMGSTDPVAWAVVRDALTHPGPARASRIDGSVCPQDVMPGVDRATLPVNLARYLGQVFTASANSPRTRTEPRLKAYAR